MDIPNLREIMPVTMEVLTEHVKASSKKGAETLKTQWLSECCEIIDQQRDHIEDLMPADDQVCVIIHYQQGFVKKSLQTNTTSLLFSK